MRHRSHVAPLFERVKRTRNDEHDLLPYEFWLDFALEFGLDLPDRYKTYRGLVVSTDQAELELVRDRNDEAHRRWIQHPSDIPSFFLSTLDLSNDRTFTDADMYKLRNPLSYFLAVLKLDGTLITDTGITWIARAANDSDAYKHLEVLSLKGLNRVTNDGVARLSKLSNLRMLGETLSAPTRAMNGRSSSVSCLQIYGTRDAIIRSSRGYTLATCTLLGLRLAHEKISHRPSSSSSCSEAVTRLRDSSRSCIASPGYITNRYNPSTRSSGHPS